MIFAKLIFLMTISTVHSLSIINVHRVIENEAPIIGILTQETQRYPEHKSYLAASYVKFVEAAGARVIPIRIGQNRKYYEDLLNKINGVLFPGGSAWFTDPDGYAEAGEHIYKIAKNLNDNGVYFPLWGTCLGFELLAFLSTNKRELRADCYSQAQALPLEFKHDYKSNRMFKDVPSDVNTILSKEAVTSNFHIFCVTEANLTKFEVNDEWNVVSLNRDFNGLEFISIIESKNYPFYGVQFHPEKNMYEWKPSVNISHTRNAIKANTYFGNFFVGEACKNSNHFNNQSEADSLLIYNYFPTYTKPLGSSFEQCYLFE